MPSLHPLFPHHGLKSPPLLFSVLFAMAAYGCSDRNAGLDPDDDRTDDTGLQCVSPDAPRNTPNARKLEVPTADSWSPRMASNSQFLQSSTVNIEGLPLLWGKWSVLLEDPEEVLFQDSETFPFHYDFLASEIPAFADLDRDEINAITLKNQGRTIAIGAVLFPQALGAKDYGIQIISEDQLHPELVVELFNKVAASVDEPDRTPVYIPGGGQESCARQDRDWFLARGIRVASLDEWFPGDQCYSGGWSVGRLVYLDAAEVETAALDGRLGPDDILLLNGSAPAELPPVAGLLTLYPSSPSSHTAILAQSFGIPFAYLNGDAKQARAMELVGKKITVGSLTGSRGPCQVSLLDLSALPALFYEQLLALMQPPPVDIDPIEMRGSYKGDLEILGRNDMAWIGGKAANYTVLRDTVPGASRPAIALTMDLWSEFLDQEIDNSSLRSQIASRLSKHTWPPAMAELDADLAAIRTLIKDEGQFTAQQKSGIVTALGGFDAQARLRFRSSTNVEDGETFTGAGLYDSFSGCLADDTDDDELGPSRCDASKAKERGVIRAIKKVYASFYARNAFVERLRRGVDESHVGMAVLVHHSFPDPDEHANGVAIFQRDFSDLASFVTQPGAVSVTNPEGGASPELVNAYGRPPSGYIEFLRNAALLPIGQQVLEDDEYTALMSLLATVADAYGANGSDTRFALDFEYKKFEGEGLVLKQVRPYPLPEQEPSLSPLVLAGDSKLCVFQGESSDVFSLHRLKGELHATTLPVWSDDAGLATTLYTNIALSYLDDGTIRSMPTSAPGAIAGFTHTLDSNYVVAALPIGTSQRRTLKISLERPEKRTRNRLPVMAFDELRMVIVATYESPVQTADLEGLVFTRSEDYAIMTTRCPDDYVFAEGDSKQERTMVAQGITVATSFYWPPGPTGATGGYTAPLLAFEKTTITGLTSQAIVLKSSWAQTQRPDHHNFGASYIFEPLLDPDVSASVVAELKAADVRAIYITEKNILRFIGLDGSIREAL